MRRTRSTFKTAAERGTVPFFLEISEKLGQSPGGFETASRNIGRGRRTRRAMANLEVVMSIAVMLPIAGAMLYLGINILTKLYQCIGTIVTWPFL
jgi:hypothetical protein